MLLPHQIKSDLSGEIRGEVVINDAVRHVYATAACIYRIMPLAVVRPVDAEDAAKVVRYAAENAIPITPRGGGSGVAGHSVGPGIILDFAPHMRSIISEGEGWIEVQPGVVLDKLNAHLAGKGRRFAPDPSSSPYCTIGGMIANNSGGARGMKYGSTREHVIGLEIITSEGEIIRTDSDNPRLGAYRDSLDDILMSNQRLIDDKRPRVTKTSSGYNLWGLTGDDGNIDPAKLVVGSEGTLAVVTGARLRTVSVAARKGGVLIAFESLARATEAAPYLRETGPSAIEVLDDYFLELVRQHRPDLSSMLPGRGQCLLLVEQEASGYDDLESRIASVKVAARKAGAENISSAADPEGAARLWEVRKAGSPIIYSMKGPKRPVRFVEDMVVPPERFAEFVGKFREILKKHDCEAPVIGHAGDGNVHVNPLLDLSDPAGKRTLKRVADEVYSTVSDFGGSLTGEHGDGRLRAPYLKAHFGELYSVFSHIKRLFDPKDVLNPDIILGDGEIIDNLRPGPVFVDTGGELDRFGIREYMFKCHGCGLCRSVCPVFDATGVEELSPRGRVALARAVAQGIAPEWTLRGDDKARRMLELCLGCHRCDEGCPTGVNPPAVICRSMGDAGPLEDKGLPGWMLNDPRRWMPLVSRLGVAGRVLQRLGTSSDSLSRLAGLNPDVKAPLVAPRSLKSVADDYKINHSPLDAVYFPGCYAIFIDPSGTGAASLNALKALGVRVGIASFACCGLGLLAGGDRTGAMKRLAQVIEDISHVPGEVPIITSCPSCEMMLKGKAFGMELMPGQEDIADRVVGIERFLADKLEGKSHAPLAEPVRAAYHTSCHQKHAGDADAAPELLRAMPGLELEVLPDACCGMGGTFGMKYRNREIYDKAGETVREALRTSEAQVVFSSCGACRNAFGAVMRTAHPVSIVARALQREEIRKKDEKHPA